MEIQIQLKTNPIYKCTQFPFLYLLYCEVKVGLSAEAILYFHKGINKIRVFFNNFTLMFGKGNIWL